MSKVIYTTYLNGDSVGLRCEHQNGFVEYIYFVPSDEELNDLPNVFVYQGLTGDPSRDVAKHRYTLEGDGNDAD